MVNITTYADLNDTTGHFQISVGKYRTIPLSYDATDSAVLSALNNLTNVGKASMLGLREHETTTGAFYIGHVSGEGTVSFKNFTIYQNLSTSISVGDSVTFVVNSTKSGAKYEYYITYLNFTASTTEVYVNRVFTAEKTSIGILVGSLNAAKTALPGRVSAVPLSQIYEIENGFEQVVAYDDITENSNVYIQGTEYSVLTSVLCPDDSGLYCINLATNYTGTTVTNTSDSVYIWKSTTTLLLSESWYDVLELGDKIWIGDDELEITARLSNTVHVSGGDLYSPLKVLLHSILHMVSKDALFSKT